MTDKKPKLLELVSDFDIGMLITYHASTPQARPMAIANLDETTGAICFTTSMDTAKVDEIMAHPTVAISFQSEKRFISLSGDARISDDRDRIHRLFKPTWKIWYPEGPTQEDIRLIDFNPSVGEYWDISGSKGLQFVWEASKALASGNTPNRQENERHAETTL